MALHPLGANLGEPSSVLTIHYPCIDTVGGSLDLVRTLEPDLTSTGIRTQAFMRFVKRSTSCAIAAH